MAARRRIDVADAESKQGTPNDKTEYTVTRDQLPVHCPLPEDSLWNSHPKVFIPVQETGEARCPYCGTEYVLKE